MTLVLVPFPFTDQTTTKKRPAVVISSNKYNKARPDIILMAITSHLSAYSRIGEAPVAEWKRAGLIKSSTIKPIITTIQKSLVIRKLGRLEENDTHALKKLLTIALGDDE